MHLRGASWRYHAGPCGVNPMAFVSAAAVVVSSGMLSANDTVRLSAGCEALRVS